MDTEKVNSKINILLLTPYKDIYVIIMEYLQDKSFSVLNKANDISEWSISHMKVNDFLKI